MYINVFKSTDDDWFNNFECKTGQQLVQVELSSNDDVENPWVIIVSGTNKTHMVRWFDNETACLTMFMQIIGWDFVNQEQLEQNLFEFGL